jgi:hypothetical protein
MVGRKIRDAAEAEDMLAAVAASEMSRPDWAHRNGVSARSLNMWRLILERRRRQQAAPLRLVEFVAEPDVQPAAKPIVVRCGPFAVEVGERFDDDLLRRVLSAVSSC